MKMLSIYLALVFALFAATFAVAQTSDKTDTSDQPTSGALAEAVFAGGCFWCVEADFEKLPGVIEAISGYTGGHVKNPTYHQVGRGRTGHFEAAKIIYNPARISYEQLLNYYWHHIDPTDGGGQFCDRGPTYRTAIFATPAQWDIALRSKQKLEESQILPGPVKTQILPLEPFYKAEKYHQDYYKKNPLRYHYYRRGCGRDKRIRQVWRKEKTRKDRAHKDKDSNNP